MMLLTGVGGRSGKRGDKRRVRAVDAPVVPVQTHGHAWQPVVKIVLVEPFPGHDHVGVWPVRPRAQQNGVVLRPATADGLPPVGGPIRLEQRLAVADIRGEPAAVGEPARLAAPVVGLYSGVVHRA